MLKCIYKPYLHTQSLHHDFQEAHAAFEQEAIQSGKDRLLLTAAVGAGKSVVEAGYEIDKISV